MKYLESGEKYLLYKTKPQNNSYHKSIKNKKTEFYGFVELNTIKTKCDRKYTFKKPEIFASFWRKLQKPIQKYLKIFKKIHKNICIIIIIHNLKAWENFDRPIYSCSVTSFYIPSTVASWTYYLFTNPFYYLYFKCLTVLLTFSKLSNALFTPNHLFLITVNLINGFWYLIFWYNFSILK